MHLKYHIYCTYVFLINPFNDNVLTINWQIICNSSKKKETHILEGLHLFLEPNNKFIPWLKMFEKVYSLSFVCALSEISILIECNVAVNSILINHQSSIAKTQFTHCISLKRSFFFFFLHAELT